MPVEGPRIFHDQVTIIVPGSTANLGPHFDGAGAALENLRLKVTLEPIDGRDIDVQVTSAASTPPGRRRGYAGALALDKYLHQLGVVTQGFRLIYADTKKNGFITGGTGLSGAESAGAIMAAAVILNQAPTPLQVIAAARQGEPGGRPGRPGHPDNVTPSVLGGIIFMGKIPGTEEMVMVRIPPPRTLGLAIGFSSHQKTGGTEATRGRILEKPISGKKVAGQVNNAVINALSLMVGGKLGVENFLRFVSSDIYHEPRRAKVGLYGNFSAKDLAVFKKDFFRLFGIAVAISGAGPHLELWFSKIKYHDGIPAEPQAYLQSWGADHELTFQIENAAIAGEGVYAYAQRHYPQSRLALMEFPSTQTFFCSTNLES